MLKFEKLSKLFILTEAHLDRSIWLGFELLDCIEGKGVHLNAPTLAEFDLHDIINVSIPSMDNG
jgi:hypothetical protein